MHSMLIFQRVNVCVCVLSSDLSSAANNDAKQTKPNQRKYTETKNQTEKCTRCTNAQRDNGKRWRKWGHPKTVKQIE